MTRLVTCPGCRHAVRPEALDAPSGRCPSCDLLALKREIARAKAAKAVGIAAAEAAGSASDRVLIDTAIRKLAASGKPFSANDLRSLLPDVAGPLVGARFNAAAKAGVIRRVGYVPSTKENTHAHPIAQWLGAA